ncbi:MAG: aldehyde dehydrogenase (NADP(+)) [Planctomycetota bacterium]
MTTTPPELSGFSIVAGEVRTRRSTTGADAFRAVNPATGAELDPLIHPATDEDIDLACTEAWTAFAHLGVREPREIARFLDAIADQVRGLGALLVATAVAETGLKQARIETERDRTVFTLRMFADLARQAEWMQPAIDTADSSRPTRVRPDLRSCLRPLGPVAVFGASNFPLAYSTAGGDTASALASGCPVIVKGHPAHPATGELVARVVAEAASVEGMPKGVFSYLAAGGRREHAIGERLVLNANVRAVGFTGSFEGGNALAAIAARRPDPIPVFAEMGSTNPIVLLEDALASRSEAIADEIAASVLGSSGQMCTCPGLLFVRRTPAGEQFVAHLADRLGRVDRAIMLSASVRTGYTKRVEQIASVRGVDLRVGETNPPKPDPNLAADAHEPIAVRPALFTTDAATFRENAKLHDEAFGPSALVVLASSDAALLEALGSVQGALAGAIYRTPSDEALCDKVRALLEHRVGRLVFNGVTTGVEVSHAMVHGGPYPATNQPHTSAVGSSAVRRWCRPTCYQNASQRDLPLVLHNENPLGVHRVVNGQPSREGIAGP